MWASLNFEIENDGKVNNSIPRVLGLDVSKSTHFIGRLPNPALSARFSFTHQFQFSIPLAFMSGTHCSVSTSLDSDTGCRNYFITDYSLNGTFVVRGDASATAGSVSAIGQGNTAPITDGDIVIFNQSPPLRYRFKVNTNPALFSPEVVLSTSIWPSSTPPSTREDLTTSAASSSSVSSPAILQQTRRLREEMARLEDKLTGANSKAGSLQRDNGDLKKRLEEANQSISSFQEEVSTLKDILTSTTANLAATEAFSRKQKDQLQSVKQELREATAALEEAQTALQHRLEQLQARDELLREGDRQIDAEREVRGRLEAELVRSANLLTQKEERIAVLKTTLEALQEDYCDKVEDNTSLKKACAELKLALSNVNEVSSDQETAVQQWIAQSMLSLQSLRDATKTKVDLLRNVVSIAIQSSDDTLNTIHRHHKESISTGNSTSGGNGSVDRTGPVAVDGRVMASSSSSTAMQCDETQYCADGADNDDDLLSTPVTTVNAPRHPHYSPADRTPPVGMGMATTSSLHTATPINPHTQHNQQQLRSSEHTGQECTQENVDPIFLEAGTQLWSTGGGLHHLASRGVRTGESLRLWNMRKDDNGTQVVNPFGLESQEEEQQLSIRSGGVQDIPVDGRMIIEDDKLAPAESVSPHLHSPTPIPTPTPTPSSTSTPLARTSGADVQSVPTPSLPAAGRSVEAVCPVAVVTTPVASLSTLASPYTSPAPSSSRRAKAGEENQPTSSSSARKRGLADNEDSAQSHGSNSASTAQSKSLSPSRRNVQRTLPPELKRRSGIRLTWDSQDGSIPLEEEEEEDEDGVDVEDGEAVNLAVASVAATNTSSSSSRSSSSSSSSSSAGVSGGAAEAVLGGISTGSVLAAPMVSLDGPSGAMWSEGARDSQDGQQFEGEAEIDDEEPGQPAARFDSSNSSQFVSNLNLA